MPEGTITDWTTAATDFKRELPQPASLPATVDGEPTGRRQVARPLREDERIADTRFWNGSGRLQGRVVIISGGDEATRQAMALLLSWEGATVAIVYKEDEEEGAKSLVNRVELAGNRAMAVGGDITGTEFCNAAAALVAAEFGKIDMIITSLR